MMALKVLFKTERIFLLTLLFSVVKSIFQVNLKYSAYLQYFWQQNPAICGRVIDDSTNVSVRLSRRHFVRVSSQGCVDWTVSDL